MLGVCAHLHLHTIVHLCMFVSDLPRQVSAGVMMRMCSFLSASFSQATKECVEHPHVQAPNQCESRREKKSERRGGEGETMRREEAADSACVSEARGKRERNKRESEMRQHG